MSDTLLLLIVASVAAATTAIVSASVTLARHHRMNIARGLALVGLGVVTCAAAIVGVSAGVTPSAPDAAPHPASAPVSLVSAPGLPAETTNDVQLPTLAFDDAG